MNDIKIEKIIDDRRAAKVEYDEYGAHLLIMNNGFQWSGASLYSIEVLGQYVAAVKLREDLEGGRERWKNLLKH